MLSGFTHIQRSGIKYYLGNISEYKDQISSPDKNASNYSDLVMEVYMSNMEYNMNGNMEMNSYTRAVREFDPNGTYDKLTITTRNYTTYDEMGSITGYQDTITTIMVGNKIKTVETYSNITYDVYDRMMTYTINSTKQAQGYEEYTMPALVRLSTTYDAYGKLTAYTEATQAKVGPMHFDPNGVLVTTTTYWTGLYGNNGKGALIQYTTRYINTKLEEYTTIVSNMVKNEHGWVVSDTTDELRPEQYEVNDDGENELVDNGEEGAAHDVYDGSGWWYGQDPWLVDAEGNGYFASWMRMYHAGYDTSDDEAEQYMGDGKIHTHTTSTYTYDEATGLMAGKQDDSYVEGGDSTRSYTVIEYNSDGSTKTIVHSNKLVYDAATNTTNPSANWYDYSMTITDKAIDGSSRSYSYSNSETSDIEAATEAMVQARQNYLTTGQFSYLLLFSAGWGSYSYSENDIMGTQRRNESWTWWKDSGSSEVTVHVESDEHETLTVDIPYDAWGSVYTIEINNAQGQRVYKDKQEDSDTVTHEPDWGDVWEWLEGQHPELEGIDVGDTDSLLRNLAKYDIALKINDVSISDLASDYVGGMSIAEAMIHLISIMTLGRRASDGEVKRWTKAFMDENGLTELDTSAAGFNDQFYTFVNAYVGELTQTVGAYARAAIATSINVDSGWKYSSVKVELYEDGGMKKLTMVSREESVETTTTIWYDKEGNQTHAHVTQEATGGGKSGWFCLNLFLGFEGFLLSLVDAALLNGAINEKLNTFFKHTETTEYNGGADGQIDWNTVVDKDVHKGFWETSTGKIVGYVIEAVLAVAAIVVNIIPGLGQLASAALFVALAAFTAAVEAFKQYSTYGTMDLNSILIIFAIALVSNFAGGLGEPLTKPATEVGKEVAKEAVKESLAVVWQKAVIDGFGKGLLQGIVGFFKFVGTAVWRGVKFLFVGKANQPAKKAVTGFWGTALGQGIKAAACNLVINIAFEYLQPELDKMLKGMGLNDSWTTAVSAGIKALASVGLSWAVSGINPGDVVQDTTTLNVGPEGSDLTKTFTSDFGANMQGAVKQGLGLNPGGFLKMLTGNIQSNIVRGVLGALESAIGSAVAALAWHEMSKNMRTIEWDKEKEQWVSGPNNDNGAWEQWVTGIGPSLGTFVDAVNALTTPSQATLAAAEAGNLESKGFSGKAAEDLAPAVSSGQQTVRSLATTAGASASVNAALPSFITDNMITGVQIDNTTGNLTISLGDGLTMTLSDAGDNAYGYAGEIQAAADTNISALNNNTKFADGSSFIRTGGNEVKVGKIIDRDFSQNINISGQNVTIENATMMQDPNGNVFIAGDANSSLALTDGTKLALDKGALQFTVSPIGKAGLSGQATLQKGQKIGANTLAQLNVGLEMPKEGGVSSGAQAGGAAGQSNILDIGKGMELQSDCAVNFTSQEAGFGVKNVLGVSEGTIIVNNSGEAVNAAGQQLAANEVAMYEGNNNWSRGTATKTTQDGLTNTTYSINDTKASEACGVAVNRNTTITTDASGNQVGDPAVTQSSVDENGANVLGALLSGLTMQMPETGEVTRAAFIPEGGTKKIQALIQPDGAEAGYTDVEVTNENGQMRFKTADGSASGFITTTTSAEGEAVSTFVNTQTALPSLEGEAQKAAAPADVEAPAPVVGKAVEAPVEVPSEGAAVVAQPKPEAMEGGVETLAETPAETPTPVEGKAAEVPVTGALPGGPGIVGPALR